MLSYYYCAYYILTFYSKGLVLTNFVSGFDNYHKIAIRDYIPVPKFYCM